MGHACCSFAAVAVECPRDLFGQWIIKIGTDLDLLCEQAKRPCHCAHR